MKKNRYLIPIFILIVGLSLFILKQAPTLEQKKTNDSNFQEQLEKNLPPLQHKPVRAEDAAGRAALEAKARPLQICAPFLTDQQGEQKPLIKTLQKFRDFYHIDVEALELSEYQLKTNTGESIVVHHDPAEENKSRVRVFKIASDGLPDRVYKFPRMDEAESKQLEGALSMGTVFKKTDKYKIVNHDGTILLFDRTNDVISKIDFTDGRNQMICENQLCQCQSY